MREWDGRGSSSVIAVFALLLMLPATPVEATPMLVEAGHVLTKLVDSVNPLDPSQSMLDTACNGGNDATIESIGVDPLTGTLYVQLNFAGMDSCIFSISPAGVVALVNPSTGFSINSRGTDLHVDPASGLLLTKDDSPAVTGGFPRIATVLPVAPGTTGTFLSLLPPFFANTFGMDFSAGIGGSDVPAGQVVFTSDSAANGIYSGPAGGLTNHLTPPLPGDDMVVQPDGDWVHVPDGTDLITAYSPAPPHNATPSPTGLNIFDMFLDADLEFIFGTRATGCDLTGDLYVSYSGDFGGTGIFRVNEALTTATLMLTIDGESPAVSSGYRAPRGEVEPREGLHDLIVGPSSGGPGRSLYFTVHDPDTLSEQVWEVTLPECSSTVAAPAPTLSSAALAALVVLLIAAGAWGIVRQRSTGTGC